MSGKSLAALCVLAAVLLGGCSEAKDLEQLKVFLQRPRTVVSGTEYRVYPPDAISISSQHVPEINGFGGQVRPDGKVNLPLLGEIFVAGRTPKEIEEILKTAAKEYYEQVDATVQVSGYNSQKIYVFGQCSAGPQAWTGNDTLLDVLARVQPNTLAWAERIKIVRPLAPAKGGYVPANLDDPAYKQAMDNSPFKRPEHGNAYELTVDLTVMYKTGDLSRNIILQPNDVIFVPPTPLAEVGLALQSLLFPVSPILETMRVPATFASVPTSMAISH